MLRLCFLIRSLHAGGAERQLVELVTRLDPSRFRTSVLTFYSGGQLERELAGTSVELVPLEKRGRWDVARFVQRAILAVKARRPDIVHGYLGVANELALLLGRLSRARTVWGIRASSLDFSQYDWSHRASFRAGAALSRFVDLAIYNSEAGVRHYRTHGYRPRREAFIPNGIDLRRFARDDQSRHHLRNAWGVQPDERLVGLVGRVDPMKGTDVFLEVANHLSTTAPRLRFVIVGDANTDYGRHLRKSLAASQLHERLIWAGPREDVAAVYSALDLLVLTSRYGEGFPNVVAEAMACEVPCVATDVGDVRPIVGQVAWVVPIDDVGAVVDACRAALAEGDVDREVRGSAGRRRIQEKFSGDLLASRTAALLEEIAR